MRTPEELASIVAMHNRGKTPTTLLEWIRAAGDSGLAVRVIDAGPDFTGAIRAAVILVPAHADEDDACGIIAHELLEHLLVAERHSTAVRAEALLRRAPDNTPTAAGPDPNDYLEESPTPPRNVTRNALRRRRPDGLPRLLPRRCLAR
jgi:hypothetical protein